MTTVTHAMGNGSMTASPTLALAGGHDDEGNAQRWLYDLEHASLAQGQAAAVPSARSAPRHTSAAAGVPALQAVPIHAIRMVDTSGAPTASASALVEALPAQGTHQMLSAVAAQRAGRPNAVSDGAPQLPCSIPPPASASAMAARVSLGTQRAATPVMFTEAQKQVQPYAPQNLHVYADGDSLQVWVRDARLAPEAAEALRAGMVDAASRAGGKTLKISINGKAVDRPAPDAPMTLPAKTGLIF